jgi:hypothetical protein
MSSGVTSCVPSVIEHTGCSGVSMPIRCATSTTASGPTTVTTCANTVFTECSVACSSVNVPDSESLEFDSVHGAPFV